MVQDSGWGPWLHENLRGEFSKPRVLRKMEEEGVPADQADAMIREVSAAKWQRARRAALGQMIGGVVMTLTAVLPSPLRVAVFFGGLVVLGNGIWQWKRGKGFARMAGVAGGEAPPSKGRMARTLKWVLAGLVVLVLVAGAGLVALGTLGPEWLKGKLVEAAREKLGADLKIDSLTFSPWTGEAELRGIAFHRKTDGSEVEATAESAKARARVGALFRRSLVLERLEIERPKVEWTVRQPPDSERATTWEKLKKAAGAALRAKESARRFEVGELAIHDGIVEFCSLKEVGEAFLARASGVQYRAKDVSLHSFGGLMWGADVDANLDLGGATAVLKKKGSATPSTFSLSRIHLAHADKFFDQSDALVVSGGGADVRYTLGDSVRVEVDLKGLELGENPAAPKQEFAFVPIPRLRELVKARQGNFHVEFAVEDGLEASDDLRVLLDEVWAGMWKALIRSMTEGTLKEAFEKGKQKVLERLKPDGEK